MFSFLNQYLIDATMDIWRIWIASISYTKTRQPTKRQFCILCCHITLRFRISTKLLLRQQKLRIYIFLNFTLINFFIVFELLCRVGNIFLPSTGFWISGIAAQCLVEWSLLFSCNNALFGISLYFSSLGILFYVLRGEIWT